MSILCRKSANKSDIHKFNSQRIYMHVTKLHLVDVSSCGGLLLLLLLACKYPGSPGSSRCMEQGAALNSGYMLAIDGDRRMMYEMIRLGVWHSLY